MIKIINALTTFLSIKTSIRNTLIINIIIGLKELRILLCNEIVCIKEFNEPNRIIKRMFFFNCCCLKYRSLYKYKIIYAENITKTASTAKKTSFIQTLTL